MPRPTLNYSPSVETASSLESGLRPSLYDAKDEFTARIAPVAVAAIYFGSFSLAPQDASLSRQALYKLSFLHRHFLHPGGVRIVVDKQNAILSGTVPSRLLFVLAEILGHQIEGIRHVEDKTDKAGRQEITARESIQLLFATDQTLRNGVVVATEEGRLILQGEVTSEGQKSWASQLAAAVVGTEVDSTIRLSTFTPPPVTPVTETPQIDDESLQALVLFRLRIVRETEHLHLKVKATRGVLTLQGKVRTEAQRKRAENIARSTLGVRELRSSLSIAD